MNHYKGSRLPRLLPMDYVPSEQDVICGRGRQYCDHAGNIRFKLIVQQNVSNYVASQSKPEKTNVVMDIISLIRKESPNGGFVDRDEATSRWYEIGDTLAREKVGHAIRFNIRSDSSTKAKLPTKEEKLPLKKRPRPVLPIKVGGAKKRRVQNNDKQEALPSIKNNKIVLPGAVNAIESDIKTTIAKKQRTIKHVKLVSLTEAPTQPTENASKFSKIGSKNNNMICSIMEAASGLATLGSVNMGTGKKILPARYQHNNPKEAVRVVTKEMLCTLERAVKSSKESQAKLVEWDRKVMGLQKHHSHTMRDTLHSRKSLLKLLRNKTKRKMLLKDQQKLQHQLSVRSKKIGSNYYRSALQHSRMPLNRNSILPTTNVIPLFNGFGCSLNKQKGKDSSKSSTMVLSSDQQDTNQRRVSKDVTSGTNSSIGVEERKQSKCVEGEDDKTQIYRLNKEKTALMAALLDSQVKRQQEQNKRVLLEQRESLISALSKTDAALKHECGCPVPTTTSIQSQPPMHSLNLSNALLASKKKEASPTVFVCGVPPMPIHPLAKTA